MFFLKILTSLKTAILSILKTLKATYCFLKMSMYLFKTSNEPKDNDHID